MGQWRVGAATRWRRRPGTILTQPAQCRMCENAARRWDPIELMEPPLDRHGVRRQTSQQEQPRCHHLCQSSWPVRLEPEPKPTGPFLLPLPSGLCSPSFMCKKLQRSPFLHRPCWKKRHLPRQYRTTRVRGTHTHEGGVRDTEYARPCAIVALLRVVVLPNVAPEVQFRAASHVGDAIGTLATGDATACSHAPYRPLHTRMRQMTNDHSFVQKTL